MVLDDTEVARHHLQREQDGAEVKSTELARLTAEGTSLVGRRHSLEAFRDCSSERQPRFPVCQAPIGNRSEPPQGTKIALAGGTDFNDHRLIWGKLDKIHTKYTDIVLLQGGSPKGADLIAAKWAETRKVTKFAFKPDWTKHAKAAPLKRNDAMLDVLPVGDLVFPGNSIQENLADKANKLGILVPKFEKGA